MERRDEITTTGLDSLASPRRTVPAQHHSQMISTRFDSTGQSAVSGSINSCCCCCTTTRLSYNFLLFEQTEQGVTRHFDRPGFRERSGQQMSDDPIHSSDQTCSEEMIKHKSSSTAKTNNPLIRRWSSLSSC